MTIDVNPARYAYGLPIFLRLIAGCQRAGALDARRGGLPGLASRQAFSLSVYALMQLVLAAQVDARLLRIDPWQLELLVYGYQVGSLVVPTLAPVLVCGCGFAVSSSPRWWCLPGSPRHIASGC